MNILDVVLRVVVFLAGLVIVIDVLSSAIKTFVLPRSSRHWLTAVVFRNLRRLFDWLNQRAQSYEERDRIMALYAPIGLLLLVPTWLLCVLVGYMLMYRAIGVESWYEAFRDSGSSLLTLGFAPVDSVIQMLLAFSEAAIGLILVALLIAYLPTIYSAFSKREAAVNLLEVRAGSPPSAATMIIRYHRIRGLEVIGEIWAGWEVWFAEVEESHTSLAALAFFRSPQPGRSWVTAAGAVLDAAAICASTIDMPRNPQAELTIRAGFLALRQIASYFRIPYDADPQPTDPISIARDEFDALYDELAAAGVPLKPDRDKAWRDFAGWRVNYDTVLLALAALTMAPYAPWSSDRSIRRPLKEKYKALAQYKRTI